MKRLVTKTLSILLATVILLTSAMPCTVYAATESEMINKVISVAQGEVGYKGTSTYSKYGEWYGWQGSWCTTFALWCFNEAGNSLGVQLYKKIVPSGGNCNSMISWFSGKGRYYTRSSGYTPKAGDLVFFDWNGDGSAQHVGIVKSISGSTVYTIEGNCSGQVKARTYTTSGSKPYNNVSAIMGYANPDWSSVAGGSSGTQAQNTTTTTKKQTTTKKSTTTSSQTTTKKSTTTTTTTTTEPTTTTTTKKVAVMATDIEVITSVTSLEIGDSVKIDYTVKPENSQAVVGYFCDDDGIIEISDGGVITATSEGTATVVVCANNDIYKHCTFTVTSPTTQVTHQSDELDQVVVGELATKAQQEKSANQKLLEMGVNVEKLTANKDLYLIPLAICGFTAIVAGSIALIKLAVNKKRNKQNNNEENE